MLFSTTFLERMKGLVNFSSDFHQYFSHIAVVSFIDEGNQSTRESH
jgi:hypothetical protein